MKAIKALVVLGVAMAVMLAVPVCAEDGEYVIPLKRVGAKADKERGPDVGVCPKTRMDTSCLTCHTSPSFKLKEPSLGEGMELPTYELKFLADGSLYFLLTDIDATSLEKIFRWMRHKKTYKKLVIEVHSPGGSLFNAYRIVSMIQDMQSDGFIVETRCYGFAASAGFYIFCAGNKGHRLASPNAEFMWHELLTFAMFQVSTPSSTEEQSRVLRHLQDTANGWLATVSNLSKEEIDGLIHKKEFWLRGTDMVTYGFADGNP